MNDKIPEKYFFKMSSIYIRRKKYWFDVNKKNPAPKTETGFFLTNYF